MKKYFLDPNTLLGRVVTQNENYQVVHLSLLAGNEVPKYQNEAKIIIFVISGKICLSAGEKLELNALELVEIESKREHAMVAVKDSQLLIIKVK